MHDVAPTRCSPWLELNDGDRSITVMRAGDFGTKPNANAANLGHEAKRPNAAAALYAGIDAAERDQALLGLDFRRDVSMPLTSTMPG